MAKQIRNHSKLNHNQIETKFHGQPFVDEEFSMLKLKRDRKEDAEKPIEERKTVKLRMYLTSVCILSYSLIFLQLNHILISCLEYSERGVLHILHEKKILSFPFNALTTSKTRAQSSAQRERDCKAKRKHVQTFTHAHRMNDSCVKST